jgi:hypothetical protein
MSRRDIARTYSATRPAHIADLKSSGAVSLRQLAAGLNERGIPTARGGEWSAVQVQRVINRAAGM